MIKIYTYLEEKFILNEGLFSVKNESAFDKTKKRLTGYGESVIEDFDEEKFSRAASKIQNRTGFSENKANKINKNIAKKVSELMDKKEIDEKVVTNYFERTIRYFNMGVLSAGTFILAPFIWIISFVQLIFNNYFGGNKTPDELKYSSIRNKYTNLVKNLWHTIKYRTPHTKRYYKRMFLAFLGIIGIILSFKIFDHDGMGNYLSSKRTGVRAKLYGVLILILIYVLFSVFKFCSELSNLNLIVKDKPGEENPTEMYVGDK